jgi:hypothetical protein
MGISQANEGRHYLLLNMLHGVIRGKYTANAVLCSSVQVLTVSTNATATLLNGLPLRCVIMPLCLRNVMLRALDAITC